MNHPHHRDITMVPIRIMESGLSSKAILTYIALASYADDGGMADPAIALLAERASLSRRSVQRGLAELVERGFVQSQRRRYAFGPTTTSVYRLQAAPNRTTLIPEVPQS